jgi:Uma2 family endonuclease
MANPSRVANDLISVEQFYWLVPDDQKADLIDGVIYIAPPDSLRANELTGFVLWLFEGFLEARGIAGDVFFSRYACRLNEFSAPEPDVGYVSPERVGLMEHGGLRGAPDIAVEIVSRDSRHRDYDEKRRLYEESGVPEYWIIDPVQERVEFLVLQEGRYRLAPLESNRIFRSQALSGFWIDVEWLLADPLPPASPCLQAILGEPGREP